MKSAIICAVITFALCISMVNFAKGEGTVIAVDPPLYVANQNQIGTNFTLNVNITNVVDLWSWTIYLNWNSDVINITNVQEGSFLKSAGSTIFLPPIRGTGYLSDIGSTLLSASGANGSGILFNATCQILAAGQSDITINASSYLQRYDPTNPYNPATISATISNGLVTVTIPEFSDILVFAIIFVGLTMAIIAKKARANDSQSQISRETRYIEALPREKKTATVARLKSLLTEPLAR